MPFSASPATWSLTIPKASGLEAATRINSASADAPEVPKSPAGIDLGACFCYDGGVFTGGMNDCLGADPAGPSQGSRFPGFRGDR
jgi:hypothetical protein